MQEYQKNYFTTLKSFRRGMVSCSPTLQKNGKVLHVVSSAAIIVWRSCWKNAVINLFSMTQITQLHPWLE